MAKKKNIKKSASKVSKKEESMKNKVEIKQPVSQRQERLSRLVGSIFIGLGVLLVAFGIFSYIKYREEPLLNPELESPQIENVTSVTNGDVIKIQGSAKGYDNVFIYANDEKIAEAKEISDEWAKEIGEIIGEKEIKTLDALKEKIKDALLKEKEHYQIHQMQDSALKLAIKECNIEIPQQAVDYEAREREKAFVEDMKSRGINIDDFLKANNITIEKMRELWKLDAKEAIEADVFLTLYADSRDIQMTDEELDVRIEEIKKQRPDVDKNIFTNTQWRENMKRVGRKEKAFNMFIEEVLGKEYIDEHN